MYLSIFKKLLKSIPDYRFPEHAVVICDQGCAYFYSDTLLCKYFLPEIEGQGVYPGDKLRALQVQPPFRCIANVQERSSQINEFKMYDVPYPSGNRIIAHWQTLAKDALEIRFDMSPQQWRSLLVSLHGKHPVYSHFHLNFASRAIETVADSRACLIENAITQIDHFELGQTKTQRAKLTIDWRTGDETTVMEDVEIIGALIPADMMHTMMLDDFNGVLRYDYHNELLEYHSYKHYPSIFDRLPRHFHVQCRTKHKKFLDLMALAKWERTDYRYFMFLCQKCLRSLRDQIRPYIDKRFRETVTFIPLPERGMRFTVKPMSTAKPMEFSLPNEQHNFPEPLWNQPVVSFDPYYLFDLLAFDGDMIVRIEDERKPVMVEIENIGLKHIVMPRAAKT